MVSLIFPDQVEQWADFELEAPGYSDGNPFTDYSIQGRFIHQQEIVTVDGFYDGEGHYKVRFMPSFTGRYDFTVSGSFAEDELAGSFLVTDPGPDNHGPLRTAGFHFVYEDGSPYYPVGTTCYAWAHQSEKLQQQTLQSLSQGYFNKIRFCIFPKHYDYNFTDPVLFPYRGNPCDATGMTSDNFMNWRPDSTDNQWDFFRFNPVFFQHFESRIKDLLKLGVEADIIIMHPYDRWGFSRMPAAADDLYYRYIIARFAAYRNVWWSLANEYDLMKEKTIPDWERYARILCEKDPYHHLRSIHNCQAFYDYTRPWITHSCIQRQDIYKCAELTAEYRVRFGKPVVLDEIAYEGNIPHGWGNISAPELVRRFWEATIRGGYAGHGETYEHPQRILWWSHGGTLHGESQPRLKFLKSILYETPGNSLKAIAGSWDDHAAMPEKSGTVKYFIYYYSFNQPSSRRFHIDEQTRFKVEVIDTWEMTVEDRGVFMGKFKIDLPGKPYMAVRLRQA